MRSHPRFAAFTLAGIVAAACWSAPPAPSDADFTTRVNAFVNEWHDDAAHARPAYFDKIARDGIYIGTDKTERWTREAFREWAKPAFARPAAWAFTPLHRNVRFSPDRTFIWFDEQVRSSMGILQATGVMRPAGASFEIVHYQLSIAVPNDVNPQVTATIKAFESK
jgi:SnoaL-like domain